MKLPARMKLVATSLENARTVLEYIIRPIPDSKPPGNAMSRRILISVLLPKSK
jgi:hypothetical protein